MKRSHQMLMSGARSKEYDMGDDNNQENIEHISGAYVEGTKLIFVDGAVVSERKLVITS